MSSKYRYLLRRFMHIKLNLKASHATLHRTHQKVTLPCTVGFSLLTLLGFEKRMTTEDELIVTIKHCVLFVQRGEFDKAEQLLHVALKQAQQTQHQLAITYIYDVMANLAMETEQYEKAKKLFVAVSQRIMADGATEDDLRIIHISVKLARISHMLKEYATAQLGYDWCLEKLYNAYKKDPSKTNTKLLAMAEDWYGRLFVDGNKIETGLSYMKKAYERMKHLVDIEQEHLVIQLNDLGTVCDRLGNVDESIEYYSKAIDLGKKFPDMHDLGVMYVNLGRAYIKKNMLDAARKSCGHGLKLGVTSKNDDVKREADLCMQQIRAMS